jgi:thiol:disulfide interchange protein DsbA
MKKILVFMMLMASSALLQAADYKEGVHYKKLSPQQSQTGENVEVLEFFWYGCPHCYTFEPYVNAWKKSKPDNVDFARVPAIFRPDWEVQARAYYALSNMGVIEDMHIKIFEAMHKQKKRLDTRQKITDFLVSNGVDKAAFEKEYNSFTTDGMVRKAKKKMKAYRIQGVPSMVINGKYLTSGSMAGSYDNMVKITNYLVEKESK